MNKGTKFISRWEKIVVEDTETPFTCAFEKGQVIKMPIAHRYGNFFYRGRKPNRVFRYVENPNGSRDDIAGVSSKNRSVVALMPHPERAVEKSSGSDDGLVVFTSLKKWLS